ncbi:hypothetical protein CVT26_010280 [Gymnopilus dilepis]|uniref:Uncharacterized protein n=1 Tax=Gymnopilus dilepis TaxID=231916 RepID=A0A409Y144_9AGAR|nr:hypothetical protein CVT26_010280 [Gymnopilus dilepis]
MNSYDSLTAVSVMGQECTERKHKDIGLHNDGGVLDNGSGTPLSRSFGTEFSLSPGGGPVVKVPSFQPASCCQPAIHKETPALYYLNVRQAKKTSKRGRPACELFFESQIFTKFQLGTIPRRQRRKLYIQSLEAHIDILRAELRRLHLHCGSDDDLHELNSRVLNRNALKAIAAALSEDVQKLRTEFDILQQKNQTHPADQPYRWKPQFILNWEAGFLGLGHPMIRLFANPLNINRSNKNTGLKLDNNIMLRESEQAVNLFHSQGIDLQILSPNISQGLVCLKKNMKWMINLAMNQVHHSGANLRDSSTV